MAARFVNPALCGLLVMGAAMTFVLASHAEDTSPADKNAPSDYETALATVVAGLEKLVGDNPSVLRYKSNLAQSHIKLGQLQQRDGRLIAAASSYQAAANLYDALKLASPQVIEYQNALVQSCWHLAAAQQAARHLDDCIKTCQRAIDVQQHIVETNPAMPEYPRGLALLYLFLGVAQRDNHQLAQAKEMHKLAAEMFEALARTDGEAKAYLPDALAAYGDTLAVALQWQDAADLYGKAVQINDQRRQYQARRAVLQCAAGDKPGYQATCAALMRKWGNTSNGVDALWTTEACIAGEEAVADMGAVVALAQRAAAADPSSPLGKTLLGAAQLRSGDVDGAIKTLKAAIPRHALAAIMAPQYITRLRISRLIGESFLALAYQQQGNREAVEEQIKRIEELIAQLESSPPEQPGADMLPWSLNVAVVIAKRDLATLERQLKQE